jgi:hypothetical protein
MSEGPGGRRPVTKIAVRLLVGANLLSGTDDPVFLGLRGPHGREFRLARARGPILRRGQEDYFVFGAAGEANTNVAMPELNDPTSPEIDAGTIEGVYLRKGLDPIPNVRALGELDDRIEIVEVAVEVYVHGRAEPLRFERSGPIWLGLVCGLRLEIPRVDASA